MEQQHLVYFAATLAKDDSAMTKSEPLALLIDDDPVFRNQVGARLAREGFAVLEAVSGAESRSLICENRFALIVLEMDLADGEGIELCREIRSSALNRSCALLFASSRAKEGDKVRGLVSGADDYLAKPFGMNEFVARVRAVLRRSREAIAEATREEAQAAQSRKLVLDVERRVVIVRGTKVALTRREFDLLRILASRPGVVFSREALLTRLPRTHQGVTERTIDAIVTRVRKKLGDDPKRSECIATAWGIGYKCADVDDD
jgi:two-component system alkaline phosphatase synthesis response regulator PhoP